MKTYRIKEGYRHKELSSAAAATQTHTGYWTPARIRASSFHQYHVYRFAQSLLDQGRIKSVIDVGCGPGTKLAMLHRAHPEVSYTGIDLAEGIEYCKRTYRFGTWLARDFNDTATAVDLPQADLVICSDVIEHVADPDRLLAYLKAALAPGGRVLLSTPERDILNGPDSFSAPNAHHMREWNFEEFRAYVADSGFVVERQELQLPVRIWPNMIFYREILR